MKITGVTVFCAREWRTMLFVRISTDAGIYGVGEAGLTSREGAVAGMIACFEPYLVDQDPMRTEHLWQVMWRSGFHPGGEVAAAAIAAIDLALWDIKGKALDVPCYELLGGKVRDKILTYTHLNGGSTETLLTTAEERAESGWRCMRWEPACTPGEVFEPRPAIDQAVREFGLLRDRLGDGMELCFDVHTKLNVADAVRLCRSVESFRPFFIEDPARSEDSGAYHRIRNQTAVPLAAGEQFGTKWRFAPLVQHGLIDYARIDLCIAGGFTEAKKIAALCETHSVGIAPHNPLGPVSTAACLHMSLATPEVAVLELPRRPGECMPDVFTSEHSWQDGFLHGSGAPGLGVDFNPDALDTYRFEPESLPLLHREDGSYTNW